MNVHAVEIDRAVERNVEILWAVNVGGIDVNIVPQARKRDRQAMDRANRATVANRRIVGGNYMENP